MSMAAQSQANEALALAVIESVEVAASTSAGPRACFAW